MLDVAAGVVQKQTEKELDERLDALEKQPGCLTPGGVERLEQLIRRLGALALGKLLRTAFEQARAQAKAYEAHHHHKMGDGEFVKQTNESTKALAEAAKGYAESMQDVEEYRERLSRAAVCRLVPNTNLQDLLQTDEPAPVKLPVIKLPPGIHLGPSPRFPVQMWGGGLQIGVAEGHDDAGKTPRLPGLPSGGGQLVA